MEESSVDIDNNHVFCIMCGPMGELDELSEGDFKIILCRQCSYQEAHGMDHIED